MLDISKTHPFEACAAFAVRLMRCQAAGDMAGAEALIDVNDTGAPFAESFPAPDGFTYAHPDQIRNWSMHVIGATEQRLGFDFEIPFAEAEYAGRSLSARFDMRRIGDNLEVRLTGAVPN